MPRIAVTPVLLVLAAAYAPGQTTFRPPATPLVAHDPYFSVWSMSDNLNDSPTRHWTGTSHELTSYIRVDGATYRIMGDADRRLAGSVQAARQTDLRVLPTRTIYRFTAAGVRVDLTFLTPALPNDLEILSRPVTYIVWDVASDDGRSHAVSIYFDASAELSINTRDEALDWSRFKLNGVDVLRAGSQEQPLLQKSGDNLRIDWGYLYVTAPAAAGVSNGIEEHNASLASFVQSGAIPGSDILERGVSTPVLAYAFDLGQTGATPISRHLLIAYDDIFSLEYMNRRLRPYWRAPRFGARELLEAALRDYPALAKRSAAFDEELMADLTREGGEEYARLCALAYRQTLAAHKLARDYDGTPVFFPKENFSNGSIDTVDVIYPSAPFFLLFNPRLIEAQVRPLLDYAASGRWPFPFAPHDLGTYPLANGQTYGGRETSEENQMPVEESGNILLMVAALTQIENSTAFAERYWPLLAKWAEYLKAKGLDPENQLCTDDFAGHLAHNANLSLKAILALGAFGKLAERTGHRDLARAYLDTAREFAQRWVTMADDGDHYRLAFDKPGTWSMKYNLVWDDLLGLHLFPPELARKEIAFYKTKQNAYGLPLDNRAAYTKLDWLVWTATLAPTPADFNTLIAPAYRFANESPTRVPLTDWYMTNDAKQRGFQARSVVGGIFIRMLDDPAMWKKWASR